MDQKFEFLGVMNFLFDCLYHSAIAHFVDCFFMWIVYSRSLHGVSHFRRGKRNFPPIRQQLQSCFLRPDDGLSHLLFFCVFFELNIIKLSDINFFLKNRIIGHFIRPSIDHGSPRVCATENSIKRSPVLFCKCCLNCYILIQQIW